MDEGSWLRRVHGDSHANKMGNIERAREVMDHKMWLDYFAPSLM